MPDLWNKSDLFIALDAARQNVTSSAQYDAITYVRRLAVRVLFDCGPHEIIGERYVNGIRVDPPGEDEEARF